ncbi:energy-coupling factor ABC transporter ATP-binding protein [Salinibacillus xinjiangensis]|uniref:Energy-coupling factor transporter ATP-binding protein EcfA2 n=1 Tax=Salinibacillus xinjiangensis TaxID=1229268 RepID=A0A6G1XAW7_9BACI|nr:energy-coupling factor ABC transporter ATP-binding protein [Salinibacillus xinjiangensis]MRG88046.1 energy-coupling factor ABC transporter ATP-binding protein [Salinibacillus xinjiangensis]
MDITFDKVSHIYQKNTPFEYKALEDVSFHISSGSYVAIIGHTGSGKSTLIQHLNGLLKPTEGKIQMGNFVLTADKKQKDIMKLRKQVGVVFQYPEHQLFEESIEKDIKFGPQNFGVEPEVINQRLPEVLKSVQLSDQLLSRSPFDLSGGQMRRVAIAGVLIMEPNLLVLDEPTAGLDPRGQKEIMDMFYRLHKEKNRTTVLVTHSMEDALQYADHVIIMDHGKLYMEGNPIEVFRQRDALQKVGLDVPEVIDFLDSFEKTFQKPIDYHGQSMDELAEVIARIVEGGHQRE